MKTKDVRVGDMYELSNGMVVYVHEPWIAMDGRHAGWFVSYTQTPRWTERFPVTSRELRPRTRGGA